jgi:capsular exopolysaccharide synthesis family protein
VLAYVVEMADKTFHDPADVSHYLNLPLVGHIPAIPAKAKYKSPAAPQLDPILVAAHRPKSQLAEAFRAVRTALYFNTRGSGHRVIQITSPTPSDGKSTLAGNLAVSIAQTGKNVLLIDADFRRPRIHTLFGLNREIGLSSVINGQAEPHDAIQDSGVANLSVMACGPRPDNPSELLTSPQFKEFLDAIRERFDFILIDTPPMLAVTDPSVVAPRVDGVLLTLRIKKNVRPGAIRATEMLSTLGANVLGAVVNVVSGKKGYGYGGYSYRYGGRYGSYRQGYGSTFGGQGYGEGYGEYYSEEDSSEAVDGELHGNNHPSRNGASASTS